MKIILLILLLSNLFSLNISAKSNDILVKTNTIYLNQSIASNLYVARGATLFIDGNTKITGNVYNWGNIIIDDQGILNVQGKIYTLQYTNKKQTYERKTCGDYLYGMITNYGTIKYQSLVVNDDYVDQKVEINGVNYYLQSFQNTKYQSKCIKEVFIDEDTSFNDMTFKQNVYISENANCTIPKGEKIRVEGNLYIYGKLNNLGDLKVKGKIYCMHYGKLNASDNPLGVFVNKGKCSANKIVVETNYFHDQVRNDQHQIKTVIEYAGLYDSGYVCERCVCCGYEARKQEVQMISKVSLSTYNYIYDGKSKKPNVIIKDCNGNAISSDCYSVKYPSGRKNKGTYRVNVTFKKYYQGNKQLDFVISSASIRDAKITVDKQYTYNGIAITPNVVVKVNNKTLTKNEDYQLQYTNNLNVGQATIKVIGINNFSGSKTIYFNINPLNINKVKIASIPTQKYNGSAIKVQLDVKYNNVSLKLNKDYTVKYENNKNVGKAKITLTGLNNFTGNVSKTFNIKPKSIEKAKINMKNKYLYSGKQIKPSVSVSLDGWTLTENKHYEIKYGSNKGCGEGSIKIKGINNYSDLKLVNFVIVPQGSKIISVKSNQKQSLNVKTNAISGAKIQISYRKKGTKQYKHIYTNKSSVTIKNLTSNANYEVKVRHFVKVDNETYFSDYSSIQNVKIK